MDKFAIKVFKYGSLPLIGLVFSVSMAAIGSYLTIRVAESPYPVSGLFFLIAIPLYAVLTIVLPLVAYNHVVLTSGGIGRSFFWFRLRMVPWNKIVGIRCGHLLKDSRFVKNYHLQTKLGSPFGGVRILSIIDNVDDLVAEIEKEVMSRKIPVFAWDENKLISLDYLPPLVKRTEGWK